MIIPALVLVLAMGALIGFFNSVLSIRLRLVPMIATMAVGYILDSAALMLNKAMKAYKVLDSDILATLVKGNWHGFRSMYLITGIIAVVVFVLVNRTTFGRSFQAVGQNSLAAQLAGINSRRIGTLAYVFSSMLAAFCGFLIFARVGGAYLGMGTSYMMDTIGAVVLGGTLISGGKCSVVGTIFACLFFSLVSLFMTTIGISSGMQQIVKGALIITVMILGTARSAKE